MNSSRKFERISPTGLYTGQTWVDVGFAPSEYGSRYGRWMRAALGPVDAAVAKVFDGYGLEQSLIDRHLWIDAKLRSLLQQLPDCCVMEIAAGASPRSWRFTTAYPDLRYCEIDLPKVVQRKQALLAKVGAQVPVFECDIMDIEALQACKDAWAPGKPVVVISEGLVNYLDHTQLMTLWGNIVHLVQANGGAYLSDMVIWPSGPVGLITKLGQRGLDLFIRSQTHIQYNDPSAVVDDLHRAGFGRAVVEPCHHNGGLFHGILADG